jgi:acid phosphatase (class A)
MGIYKICSALGLSLALGAATIVPARAQAAASVSIAPASTSSSPKPKRAPIYIAPDFLDPALTLPAPPKPDSVDGKAELENVRKVVQASSVAQIAQAAIDDKNESVIAFADVIPGFDVARLPVTAKLFDAVRNDEDYEATRFKAYFARARPFELDRSIPTCVPSAPSSKPSSYPSGHATMGYSMAIILAHLMPERADAILARAKSYAENRVVCGVHFSSDLAASQTLGSIVATELLENAAFNQELARARAELIAAGLAK